MEELLNIVFKNGKLSDTGIALIVDAMILDCIHELPTEIETYLEQHPDSQAQVQELFEVMKETDPDDLRPHPLFDSPAHKINKAKYFTKHGELEIAIECLDEAVNLIAKLEGPGDARIRELFMTILDLEEKLSLKESSPIQGPMEMFNSHNAESVRITTLSSTAGLYENKSFSPSKDEIIFGLPEITFEWSLFHDDNPEPGPFRIRILSASGEQITAKYSEENMVSISTESWPTGIYFWSLIKPGFPMTLFLSRFYFISGTA